jgi:hypothetical protein
MADDTETRPLRPGAGKVPASDTATATELGAPSSVETIIPVWNNAAFATLPDPGYQLGEVIGRGGMGEVVVARDQRIGREVAVKRIRSETPSSNAVTRFLREARIQARLDHPAIVPVYELGTDADGRLYFTMKRLTGVTLHWRIYDGSSTQPLVRAFVDVCLAVHFAHARGVVHRDLKPANIMLGDYGEVYVLDWGIARVLADGDRSTRATSAVDDSDGTTAGAILGTPGYMAPEQVESHDVERPADVYALGAILFEILTAESLHPRGDAAFATTLATPQVAPATRAPRRVIPPELDSACFDALAKDPALRPTARQLADRVQAYLDGDRDVERRRVLAATELAAARDALASGGDDARATATRRAGRALALDPESTEAAGLVTTLILEPPAALPATLVASLEADERMFMAQRSRAAAAGFFSLFALWALVPFLDIKSWGWLVALYVVIGAVATISYTKARTRRPLVAITTVMITLVWLMFSRVAGPFVLTPIVACGCLMAMVSMPFMHARPWFLISWTVAAMMVPLVLEWTDVLHSTYAVGNDVIGATSDIFRLQGRPVEEIALVIANIAFILVTLLFAITIVRGQRAAQTKLRIRDWHLRQLLPRRSKPKVEVSKQ